MNDLLEIRQVKSSDFDQWILLWDSYNKFYGRFEATALPFEITKKTWDRLLNSAEPVHAIVAEIDGTLIGFAHFLYHRSTILIEPTCYLQDLFVTEEARGNGVGKSLIEVVCNEAKNAGATRVYWHTHESNKDAMKLYDKIADKTGFLVYRKII